MEANSGIVIKGLCKNFGDKQVLKKVDLDIGKGMFGLLGRNGAGKTTFMRILSGLIRKSEGEVRVCGVPVENNREIRNMTGYLPQEFSFYPDMTVYQSLDYLALLSGLDKKTRKERVAKLITMVNLDDKKRAKFKSLSGGMKRRLGIAQALIGDPKVLIVDEPTAGLDPEERVRFRNILSDIAKDRVVILSTHIVEDVEKTCENIAVLREGQLIYNGRLEDFIGNENDLESAYIKRIGGK